MEILLQLLNWPLRVLLHIGQAIYRATRPEPPVQWEGWFETASGQWFCRKHGASPKELHHLWRPAQLVRVSWGDSPFDEGIVALGDPSTIRT